MKKNEVFELHYENYLKQLKDVDFEGIHGKLGAQYDGKELNIRILNEKYRISKEGIFDGSNKRPSYEICIILFKYILLCPLDTPKEKDWIAFRNFRDSGPLITYFSNNVENRICDHFSGKLLQLEESISRLNASKPDDDLNYDLKARFSFLPKLPLLLLFNDRDEDFPAGASVLFEKCAEAYLDAECLAMVGFRLAYELTKNL